MARTHSALKKASKSSPKIDYGWSCLVSPISLNLDNISDPCGIVKYVVLVVVRTVVYGKCQIHKSKKLCPPADQNHVSLVYEENKYSFLE